MTVEVVGRKVQENPYRRCQRGCEIDLVGGAFDDVVASGRRWVERHDGAADIAARLRVAPRPDENVRNERCSCRLSVGAGDRNERRPGRTGSPLPGKKLNIAD